MVTATEPAPTSLWMNRNGFFRPYQLHIYQKGRIFICFSPKREEIQHWQKLDTSFFLSSSFGPQIEKPTAKPSLFIPHFPFSLGRWPAWMNGSLNLLAPSAWNLVPLQRLDGDGVWVCVCNQRSLRYLFTPQQLPKFLQQQTPGREMELQH